MQIGIVVAVDRHGVMAVDGKIPWHCKEDLQHFRSLTKNHAVIMGRRTFFSLPGGPLHNRLNIVVSRDESLYDDHDVIVCKSLDEAFSLAESIGCDKAFVIGGHDLYYQAMLEADRLHLTVIDVDAFKLFSCHTYFPMFAMIAAALHDNDRSKVEDYSVSHGNGFTIFDINLAELRNFVELVKG